MHASEPPTGNLMHGLKGSPPPATLDPAQASPLTALLTREAAEPARRSVWRNLLGEGEGKGGGRSSCRGR